MNTGRNAFTGHVVIMPQADILFQKTFIKLSGIATK